MIFTTPSRWRSDANAKQERIVTMIDEMFDRGYQAAREEFNAGIANALGGVGQTIGESLRVLHRIEWSAPWAPPKKKVRRA
jgi:hypothetical protein